MTNLDAFTEPHPAGFRDVYAERAARHLPELRVIDVRGPDEFCGPVGHIPGAELVPLPELRRASRHWRRDEALLVVCRSGARSALAAMQLGGSGFTRVYNLMGGMAAWNAHGLPAEGRP